MVMLAVIAGSVSLKMLNRRWRETERVMAREKAAQREISSMADALERFRNDVLRYPTNDEGLRSLGRRPAVINDGGSGRMTFWYGPYLDNVPEVDPWGNDYIYKTADDGRSFELFSYGPGGETGSDSRFRVASTNATAANN